MKNIKHGQCNPIHYRLKVLELTKTDCIYLLNTVKSVKLGNNINILNTCFQFKYLKYIYFLFLLLKSCIFSS